MTGPHDPVGVEALVERPSALCVDRAGLAVMLGISEREIYRLDAKGKIPASLPLCRHKRWGVEEIRDWVRAGSPPRQRWMAMRRSQK